MSDTRPVVVRLSDGCEYGLPDIKTAKRIYPAGEIVRYQDGTAIEAEVLDDAGLTPAGDVPVNAKMTRPELEAIATGLGIEGADNKAAYKDKPALVEAIGAKRAELAADEPVIDPDPDAAGDGGDDSESSDGESGAE